MPCKKKNAPKKIQLLMDGDDCKVAQGRMTTIGPPCFMNDKH
jgi:hypothetical protein